MAVGCDGGLFGKVTVKTPARSGAQTLSATEGVAQSSPSERHLMATFRGWVPTLSVTHLED